MRLSRRDVGLLIILLGIIVFLVCYLAIYNPTVEENEALQSEISSLRPVLDELKAKEAKIPEYEAGMEQSREIIKSIQDGYPIAVRTEDFIMYTLALEALGAGTFDTQGISFSDPVLLAEMDSVLSPAGETEFGARQAYKAGSTMNAHLTYGYMKELVGYIYNESTKTTLDSISLSYNGETGALSGTVTVGKFFMTSDSDPYIPTEVPPMEIGAYNPFHSFDTLDALLIIAEDAEGGEGEGLEGEGETEG